MKAPIEKGPYGGDIDGDGDETDEGEALGEVDESDRDNGTGITDAVISVT